MKQRQILVSKKISAVMLVLAMFSSALSGMAAAQSYAPDFQFSVSNKQYALSDLRGKVVVLDFWASWCQPCRRSLPEISRLDRKFDDVLFLGINHEDLQTIHETEKALGLGFPTILDERGTITDLYGVESIPTTVVIDVHGLVSDVVVGFHDDDTLERAINRARRRSE